MKKLIRNFSLLFSTNNFSSLIKMTHRSNRRVQLIFNLHDEFFRLRRRDVEVFPYELLIKKHLKYRLFYPKRLEEDLLEEERSNDH